MSLLEIGTLCITLERRDPHNAGRVVRVLGYLGEPEHGEPGMYAIETVSDRPFATTFYRDAAGRKHLRHHATTRCRAPRAYLRPLLHPDVIVSVEAAEAALDPMRPAIDGLEAALLEGLLAATEPATVDDLEPDEDDDEPGDPDLQGIVTIDLALMGMTLEEYFEETDPEEELA